MFSPKKIGPIKNIRKYLKPILAIIVVAVICWNFYSIGNPLIEARSGSFAGHEEAGKWMQENIPEDTAIFAGSPRMVRAFVEREYYSYGNLPGEDRLLGGTIWWLRGPKYLNNQTLFEDDLKLLAAESDVYLEIDVWESTQPKWYFPINQESINYFTGLGFQPVKIVERQVQTNNGLQSAPVIFILKKDKVSE